MDTKLTKFVLELAEAELRRRDQELDDRMAAVRKALAELEAPATPAAGKPDADRYRVLAADIDEGRHLRAAFDRHEVIKVRPGGSVPTGVYLVQAWQDNAVVGRVYTLVPALPMSRHFSPVLLDGAPPSAPRRPPMTAHRHAHILLAVAAGKAIQTPWPQASTTPALPALKGVWYPITPRQVFAELASGAPCPMRVAPAVISIAGIDVPEPLRELPPGGRIYWPDFGLASADDWVDSVAIGSRTGAAEKRLLAAGVLHDNREAAATHARAILALTAPC